MNRMRCFGSSTCRSPPVWARPRNSTCTSIPPTSMTWRSPVIAAARHDHRRPRRRRRLALGQRLGGGLQVRAHRRGGVALHLRPRRRMDDVGHVLAAAPSCRRCDRRGRSRPRTTSTASAVSLAMWSSSVCVACGTALPVGQQHAVVADDDQADGREARLANLLVAVDVLGQRHDPREVGELRARASRETPSAAARPPTPPPSPPTPDPQALIPSPTSPDMATGRNVIALHPERRQSGVGRRRD